MSYKQILAMIGNKNPYYLCDLIHNSCDINEQEKRELIEKLVDSLASRSYSRYHMITD